MLGKKLFQDLTARILGGVTVDLENLSILQGRMASWHVRSVKTAADLTEVEFKVSSQWGEDGIIDWLIERVGIASSLQTFIEFGVETYREANTTFLLQNRNWRGYIMDGSAAMDAATQKRGLRWKYDLRVQHAFIDRENINALLAASGFGKEIGLLSIDLDGNDYWIWEAIHAVRPILCICEYNAIFGDIQRISVPYDPLFRRAAKHSSTLYYGASIAALESLGSKLGYRLLGTNSAANNAFFIREDYAHRLEGALTNNRRFPSRFRESRDGEGRLTYVSGPERAKLIASMPVIDTETGETHMIGDFEQLYSPEWLEAMTST
jgi:hypothetical protein